MIKVILMAPISGVTGGIKNWTNIILSYASTQLNSNVEIIPFDFTRQVNGALFANIFIRIWSCIKDYISLTIKASHFIRRTEADIVHITTPSSFLLIKDLILIASAHRSGKKVVVHFHFGRIPKLFRSKNWERFLINRVVRKSECTIVMDKTSMDVLLSAGYTNVYNIPNPVSPAISSIIEQACLKTTPNSILFAGHVLKSKGVEELITACKSIPSSHLKIIGAVSDKYKTELLSMAGPNSGSWLEIRGELDYPSTIREMCSNAVFVLPSYTEGFPNVILESMACSCAIVATSVGAIPQMLNVEIPGKECGIVVPPKDVEQLSNAISRMLTDNEFADKCRNNARERLLENYTVSKVWGQLENIWRNVIFVG